VNAAARVRLAILASGRGSNLQSIIDATRSGRIDAGVEIVVSNRSDAPALVRAREAGIETRWIDPRQYADRASFEEAIVEILTARSVHLVCLAGYMRLVGAPLLNAFPHRILNIHPSLLPSFPGLDAQRQALEHGVRITGATVHLVTSGLDDGPIIVQAAVPILAHDTVEGLSARILVEEHRIYPEAIQMVLSGKWHVEDRRFIVDS